MRPEILRIDPVDHVRGPEQAPVVLIEYGDFQCPYCRNAEDPLRRICDVYQGDLAFVFRHFPLTGVHEWAERAAIASEAASVQGRFWEMHDGLFERQDSLSVETFQSLASELGLDLDRFTRDLSAKHSRERVEHDLRSANELQLEGTPSILINGELFLGTLDFASLSWAVAGLLRKTAA